LFFGLPVAGGVRAKRIRHPMVAGSGLWAATIPAQNCRITTITATNTIPVQADIMAVDLKAITVAVLMAVVAADTAGIEPSSIHAAMMNAELTLPDFRRTLAAWQ
jgi:hypothetical protein